MDATARRQFLKAGTSLAVLGALPRAVLAAMGPNDKFDLLVRNANVLDPSQRLSGRRDIGIRYGLVEEIAPTIAAERGARVLDVGGRLVTPGLIDLHCHTYPYGSAIGIPADELVAHQCTTTVVSAGDAGANNFAAYRRFVVPASRTRQYAFVHIAVAGLAGFPVPELYNIDYALPEAAARAVAENADMVLGVKVRMSENVDRPPRPGAAASRDQGVRAVGRARQGDVPHRRRRRPADDVAAPRPAAPRRRPHALLFRARRTSPATAPTSSRTASSCRPRSRRSAAA